MNRQARKPGKSVVIEGLMCGSVQTFAGKSPTIQSASRGKPLLARPRVAANLRRRREKSFYPRWISARIARKRAMFDTENGFAHVDKLADGRFPSGCRRKQGKH